MKARRVQYLGIQSAPVHPALSNWLGARAAKVARPTCSSGVHPQDVAARCPGRGPVDQATSAHPQVRMHQDPSEICKLTAPTSPEPFCPRTTFEGRPRRESPAGRRRAPATDFRPPQVLPPPPSSPPSPSMIRALPGMPRPGTSNQARCPRRENRNPDARLLPINGISANFRSKPRKPHDKCPRCPDPRLRAPGPAEFPRPPGAIIGPHGARPRRISIGSPLPRVSARQSQLQRSPLAPVPNESLPVETPRPSC